MVATLIKFDVRVHAALLHAVVKYDKRLSASEAKRGNRVNVYRMGHLCGALNNIQERVEGGMELRAAIMKATCGSLCRQLLKAAGCAPMTREEDR